MAIIAEDHWARSVTACEVQPNPPLQTPNHRLQLAGRRGSATDSSVGFRVAAVEACNCAGADWCPQLKRGSLRCTEASLQEPTAPPTLLQFRRPWTQGGCMRPRVQVMRLLGCPSLLALVAAIAAARPVGAQGLAEKPDSAAARQAVERAWVKIIDQCKRGD